MPGLIDAHWHAIFAGLTVRDLGAPSFALKQAIDDGLTRGPRVFPSGATHLRRWYQNVDILRMATSVNGELLSLSGPRNPYPGKLGVAEEDALADLLVVNDDPIADITLLEKPDTNLAMIMKGGPDIQGSPERIGGTPWGSNDNGGVARYARLGTWERGAHGSRHPEIPRSPT